MQTPYTRNSSEDLSTRARGVRRQCKPCFLLTILSPVSTALLFSAHDEEGGDNEKQSSLIQLALYVGLSLLVLLLVIIITWKVRDKHKKNVAGSQNLGRTLNPEPEYAVIDRTGISEGDPPGQTPEEPGADVTYSSIVLPVLEVSSGCSPHCPAVNPASDVIYSSVTLKHRE
ncbi:uncharacterized protein LOC125740338 [Brienomyrus brachyistius]|uniref:uncharacterized protein LOC125740338 n=1 Tax=Brienomyrus brachyistius TaxID=42636 RepID=UPI0020B29549|nr:uncharacterized protein LOC125740338 [Brienomyrus brachyistius]